jgi:hypothetical protein
MKMSKLILLGALVMLVSACSTHKDSKENEMNAEPEYKIYSLESGSTAVEIPENKKTINVSLNTKMYNPSISTRERSITDVYEQICISKKNKTDQDITLIACFNEKGFQQESMNTEENIFTKEEVSKGIERISIPQGLKIDTFSFDLDSDKQPQYTTRKMASYDEPETYMVIRLLANKNVWSGKRMLYIQEN